MTDQKQISFEEIKEAVAKKQCENIVLLLSTSSYKLSGMEEKFKSVLSGHTIKEIFVSVKNLSIDDISTIISEIGTFNPDLFIAMGGGSVIDASKIANLIISSKMDITDLSSKNYGEVDLAPMIAIPTTSGSGSEATQFAVVYNDKIKLSILSASLLPEFVILEPKYAVSMPERLAAVTGFDAFSQAVESYWSVNSTDESKAYAEKSLRLIREFFVTSVLKGNLEARGEMQKAAYYAGKAINISKTTICHAISYPLSAYFNIPHGLAVYLLLPSIFKFNAAIDKNDCCDSRGTAYVKATLSDIEKLLIIDGMTLEESFDFYMNEFNMSQSLSSYGVNSSKDIDIILKNGFSPERAKNNPRVIDETQLKEILLEIK